MTDAAREARRLRKAELALRALGKHGNSKKAAAYLGISESTLRRHVAAYVALKGFESAVQALFYQDPAA